ncbi:hypothetical protein H0H92_002946 [Tricholoma furcatifolium]|nr:hypothetical protein H0H92_002946 [Tricholoma furcatifolium]
MADSVLAPLSVLDQGWLQKSSVTLGYVLKGVDCARVQVAAQRMVNKWRLLAGQLEWSEKLSGWCIRVPLRGDASHRLKFTTEKLSIPLDSPLPSLDADSVDILPQPSVKFFRHPSTPSSLSAYSLSMAPIVSIHITELANCSCVGITVPHGVFDAFGLGQVVYALNAELHGLPWIIPEFFEVNILQEELDKLATAPHMYMKDPIAMADVRREFVGTSMKSVLAFGARLGYEHIWKKMETRSVYLGERIVHEVLQKVKNEAKESGAEWVSTGDVLVAWLLKAVFSRRRDDSPVHLTSMISIRDLMSRNNHAFSNYPHNCFMTCSMRPFTQQELATNSLTSVAIVHRKAIETARNIPFVQAYHQWMTEINGKPVPRRTFGVKSWSVSNQTVGNFDMIDFGFETLSYWLWLSPVIPDNAFTLNKFRGGYLIQAVVERARWDDVTDTIQSTRGRKVFIAPKQFLTLPLGNVRPAGWLMDQLQVQTDGLAGNLHKFYDYLLLICRVNYRSRCDAALSNLTGLEETPTTLISKKNGLVPNGVLANNADINEKTSEFLSTLLAGLGQKLEPPNPDTFGEEVNASLTDSVVSAMYKFVSLANTMLHDGGQGIEPWTATRWEDFVITLQWLYDNHPNGQEALLTDTMEQLKWNGVPWEEVFEEQYFPTGPVEDLPNPFNLPLTWHGVNMAEGLKALPATYRFTHNQSGLLSYQYYSVLLQVSDLDRASSGWDLLFEYHGRPSGIYAADEYLAGLEAVRGTELCLVVVERIAYNSLPGTLTGGHYYDHYSTALANFLIDMWSRQYLQEQNQIAAKNMSPDTLTTTITATSAFTYYVRIPGWVVNGTIAINGGAAQALSPNSNGLQTVSVGAGTTTFILDLPAEITTGEYACLSIEINLRILDVTESRPHGSIAVHRGSLHYAFDISRSETVLTRNSEQPLAADLEFDATEAWEYAIDPTTLKFQNVPPASGELPSPVFDSGKSPLSITVTACPITWAIGGNTFATSPPTNPACTGAQTTLTLTPYGTTKLRIGEFPVFQST